MDKTTIVGWGKPLRLLGKVGSASLLLCSPRSYYSDMALTRTEEARILTWSTQQSRAQCKQPEALPMRQPVRASYPTLLSVVGTAATLCCEGLEIERLLQVFFTEVRLQINTAPAGTTWTPSRHHVHSIETYSSS